MDQWQIVLEFKKSINTIMNLAGGYLTHCEFDAVKATFLDILYRENKKRYPLGYLPDTPIFNAALAMEAQRGAFLGPLEQKYGVKIDEGKVRTDLLPTDALLEIAQIMTDGAKKYGAHSWEQGTKWSEIYAAALRHLFDYWKGQDRDKESGSLTIAHAACNCLFLLAYELRGIGVDDRKKLIQYMDEKVKTDPCCGAGSGGASFLQRGNFS